MGAHLITTKAVLSTPVAVERFKTTDSNRNPDTDIQHKAEQKRDNAMKDSPGTTILMWLSQFHIDCLYGLAADFDQVVDAKYAASVWLSFQAKLGKIAQAAGPARQQRKKPLEKHVSSAWEEVDSMHHLCPNHVFNTSEDAPDESDDSKYKVDASFIAEEDWTLKRIVRGRPNWPYIRFLIEFKRGGTACDPFDDTPGQDPDATAKSRTAVRGQLMSYGQHVFSYQHRVAVYLLFVNGETFRVMRWDRAGVIVTEAINYVSTISGTKALLMVTYALSKLSLEQQGFDLNVILLSPGSCGYQRMDVLAEPSDDDVDYHEQVFNNASDLHDVFTKEKTAASYGALFDGADALLHIDPSHTCKNLAKSHASSPPVIPVLTFIRKLFKRSLVQGQFPRYAIKLGGRTYLVAKHIFIGFGLVGRGTRGYVALEWETQRFVFLKDSWRPYYDGLEQEGAVLSALNAKNILNVPTVLRYGDVHYTTGDCLEQETETSHYSPVTGTKEADHSYPVFVTNPAEEAALQRWLQSEQTDGEPPLDYQDMPATWQPGHVPSNPEDNPLVDVMGPVSMPELVAGPSKNAQRPPASRGCGGNKRSAEEVQREDKRTQGYGLRHLVHTRLVVKEVCLPMTEFTSSFQLTNIICECITAHSKAYKLCKYIHRDVSAGNILIYPVIKFSNGRWSVYWRGLLADWELAKHADKHTALQPQRTGTWHFMSAYLLDHPGSPSNIPDELESFLHVYVYGAVRRLRSNLLKIDGLMQSYFAGFELDALSVPSCPSSKRLSVVEGSTLRLGKLAVVFSNPDGTVTQEHPLNRLIAELLRLFHSRYVVLAYQEQERSAKPELSLDPHTPARNHKLDTIMELPMEVDEPSMVPSLEKLGNPAASTLPRPSQADFDAADSLSNHDTVLGLFYAFLTTMRWSPGDVVPDRLKEVVTTATVLQAAQVTGGVAGTAAVPQLVVTTPVEQVDAHVSGDVNAPAPAVDTPVARPSKRRRQGPVQHEADSARSQQPVAGPSTGLLTRSRSSAQAAAAARPEPATTTRITRSKSGVLPNQGSQASGSSLSRTRSGSGQSNALSRSGSGAARGRTRASSQAGPRTGGDEQGGNKGSKGKGVAGRSRRR